MTSSRTTLWAAGTAAIALLVVVAGYFLVLAPQRAEAADLATQRNAVEQQNAALELQNQTLAARFEQLPERRARLAEILATIPSDDELPGLLRQLQGFDRTSGAAVTQFTAGAPELWDTTADASARPAVVDVPVVLTTTGSFAQTQQFLTQVQAGAARFFLVEQVSLSNDTSGGTTPVVTATISGKVFALAEDPAATTGATAAATASPATTTAEPTASPTETS